MCVTLFPGGDHGSPRPQILSSKSHCILHDGGGRRRETTDRPGRGFKTNVSYVSPWFIFRKILLIGTILANCSLKVWFPQKVLWDIHLVYFPNKMTWLHFYLAALIRFPTPSERRTEGNLRHSLLSGGSMYHLREFSHNLQASVGCVGDFDRNLFSLYLPNNIWFMVCTVFFQNLSLCHSYDCISKAVCYVRHNLLIC